ncbi:MAG TPA: glycosyltransferase, partial [Caulobacteraceae bacterium]|nr:glycosyltransferase [Caulobacteraceae bacterium]
MNRPAVSVVMPTFRRPGPMTLAARSVVAQAGFAPGEVELIVVDNDPDGSALDAFEALAAESPISVTYVHAR